MEEKKNDMNLFKIDFGVGAHSGLTNEVDNPFFAYISGEVETVREIAA